MKAGLALGVGALVAGLACAPSFRFAGDWRGHRDIEVKPGEDAAMLRTISRIDLKIEPDGHFDMVDAGMPKSGRVRYGDGKAFLEVKTLMNRPIEEAGPGVQRQNREIELTPDGPDALLFHDPAGFDPGPIRLERQSQPHLQSSRK